MPNILDDLVVEEVSLVDRPANSEKGIARARVALFKRADDAEVRSAIRNTLAGVREHKKQTTQEHGEMKLKQILKSATRTREAIAAAVVRKAEKVAKREGVSPEIAQAQVWRDHPEAALAYENAPKGPPKRAERKTFQATHAEAELDSRARRRMKRTPGLSYAKACAEELTADPALYERYEKELAAGATYLVPEPQDLNLQPGEAARMYDLKKSDDDGDECPDCEEDVDAEDKFCSNCGADLSKRKSNRRPAA